MQDVLNFISDLLWGSVLIYLLLGAGIWFTLSSGFIQFRYFHHVIRNLKKSLIPAPDGITAFQALCTSLAARVGSGNLAGVALAITVGGPGAVFWMWVTGIIGMATSFAECTLAQLYKGRDQQGNFRGGPAWYMERGLGMRWMGIMFAIFLLFGFGMAFNAVQAKAIANAFRHAFAIPELATGIVLMLLTGIVIAGGLKLVARTAQWLVPVMSLLWVSISAILMVMHFDQIPGILLVIVKSAFGWHEVATGAMSYTLGQAITIGFQRGMFSNEAGLGSAPNAAAAASSWPPHPVSQGIVQMIGVFIDTIVICSATAAVILLSGLASPGSAQGTVLAQQSLSLLAGEWASAFIAAIVFLFAFTSIIANYAYAENNLVFLRQNTPGKIRLLRAMVLLTVLLGALGSLTLIWQFTDIVMALMAVTNLTAILLLSPIVKDLAADYRRQRRLGLAPVFDPDRFPQLSGQLVPGVWKAPES
ncbi:alanine/glycine:cation symporter family protein [Entomohabitans teleogrylli]|uniref:alanine/glycine:cation symporter family protein n=1 Tax=Entomohabitans teleogrylli TaxID=1384589 RepID=UPI00073D9E5E|nr:sodium:alanine symporter family protein [Entomohabitans teleogrylli]